MTTIRYGARFSSYAHLLKQGWELERAREHHQAGKPYCATLMEGERPLVAFELYGHGVTVYLFDAEAETDTNGQWRCKLTVVFRRQPDGRLFLKSARRNWFTPESEQLRGPRYVDERRFELDGTVHQQKHDLLAKMTWKATHQVPVSGAWADYPDFGDCEKLFRKVEFLGNIDKEFNRPPTKVH